MLFCPLAFFFASWGGLGVTAGVHRLWCHRSYQAKWPLRLFLIIGQSITYETSVHDWTQGHRLHHKYTDTDADPHNVNRGFCFSHIGWVFKREHPLCDLKAKGIDCKDVLEDPLVRFQHEYYLSCYLLASLVMPVWLTVFLTGGSVWNAFVVVFASRNVSNIHATFFVNSWAHMFGERPYNDKLAPAENPFVSFIAFGEGYHNYHHSFPWDYGAGELGNFFNVSKHFIDLMAFFGLAYGLRQASAEAIASTRKRAARNLCETNSEF